MAFTCLLNFLLVQFLLNHILHLSPWCYTHSLTLLPRNPVQGHACCEARVLTTSPPCHPQVWFNLPKWPPRSLDPMYKKHFLLLLLFCILSLVHTIYWSHRIQNKVQEITTCQITPVFLFVSVWCPTVWRISWPCTHPLLNTSLIHTPSLYTLSEFTTRSA